MTESNRPGSRETGDAEVAVEMERIFGGVAHVGPAPERHGRPGRERAKAAMVEAPGRARRSRGARLATLILSLLAIVVAGLWFLPIDRLLDAASYRAPAPPAEPGRQVAAAPPPRRPAPQSPSAAPTVEAPSAVESAAPSPTPSAAIAAAETAPVARPTAARRSATTTRRSRRGTATVLSRNYNAASRTSRDARRKGGDCRPGSTSNACIYRDVRNAHDRLEDAYRDAARAGVDRRDLVDVRRRWDRARDMSLAEPDETIRRYNDLAAYLRTAARRDRN